MAVLLLTLVTLAYAGYNILIGISGGHAPRGASTTILATLCLQAGAVIASTCFLAFLLIQGGHSFRLTMPAYLWALGAGLCIGLAEVGYFYLFGDVAGDVIDRRGQRFAQHLDGFFGVDAREEFLGFEQVLGQ